MTVWSRDLSFKQKWQLFHPGPISVKLVVILFRFDKRSHGNHFFSASHNTVFEIISLVYICSRSIQLTVGSRDLSEEKRLFGKAEQIRIMTTIWQLFHPGPFSVKLDVIMWICSDLTKGHKIVIFSSKSRDQLKTSLRENVVFH